MTGGSWNAPLRGTRRDSKRQPNGAPVASSMIPMVMMKDVACNQTGVPYSWIVGGPYPIGWAAKTAGTPTNPHMFDDVHLVQW
jgi:hypothetical protein